MFVGGMAMLLLAFVLPVKQLVWWGVLPITILVSLISVGYSYLCYRTEKNQPESIQEPKNF